jgi:ketosteroid isomerase-like protein
VVATQYGRGKGSGVDVETTYAVLYEIQDGKVTAVVAHPSREDALDAAGLSE